MGRAALLERNSRRKKLIALYADRRFALLSQIRDKNMSYEGRLLAYSRLRLLPRDAAPTRLRNVCAVTGRSRGYYRDFGVSRIVLRQHALFGDLPGVFKGSL